MQRNKSSRTYQNSSISGGKRREGLRWRKGVCIPPSKRRSEIAWKVDVEHHVRNAGTNKVISKITIITENGRDRPKYLPNLFTSQSTVGHALSVVVHMNSDRRQADRTYMNVSSMKVETGQLQRREMRRRAYPFAVEDEILNFWKNTITGIEYRNDPTIFAWELMNEPRCISDPSGDTLQDWIEEMSAFVKTIDKNHLLTVGLEGFYGLKNPKRLAVNPELWASSLGSDFVRNSKVPAIDFASVHIYPDHWFPHLEFEDKLKYVSKWMLSHIEDGHYELNKPVFFTEFGLSNLNKDFQPSQRDRFYKTIFDIIYKSAKRKRAGAGALIWQLFVEGMDEFNDDFGFVPWERESTYRQGIQVTGTAVKSCAFHIRGYDLMPQKGGKQLSEMLVWINPLYLIVKVINQGCSHTFQFIGTVRLSAEVEAMEVLEASFTTTSLATEGELAANPINGSANDQTYFFNPYEDPDSRFQIQNRRGGDPDRDDRKSMSDREEVLSRLKILHESEKRLKYDMVWRKKPQEHLQLALDKLSFANSAYQDREINSWLVSDDINYRNLNFKMLHGSKNLAAENKILREIKASEKGKIVSLWSSLTEIDNSIYRLRYTLCYPSHDSAGGDKQMLKEMKQLEIAREKAVANASVKGKIWNSLGTKKALQEEFKIKDKELEDIKKEHLLLKPDIKKADKELQRVEKDIISLQHQLTHLRRRMEEAYQHIVLLQKE
ncbi:hypothetical protein DKX38_020163 [Salix brachista]|uniref:mannan endo-1,4-beta-mannosidase n=2 Tax=Salix TaxID=40685 RepID=A0A5N5KI93_9ROSI|nr:hypothetical protein DKX38_020163 [Salix brachista]